VESCALLIAHLSSVDLLILLHAMHRYKKSPWRAQGAGQKLGFACLCLLLVGIWIYSEAVMKSQTVPMVGLVALSALLTGCGAAPTTTIDAEPYVGSTSTDLYPPPGSTSRIGTSHVVGVAN